MIIASIMSRKNPSREAAGKSRTAVLALTAIAALLALAMLADLRSAQAQIAARKTGESGLPLPRFVSLKADRVNVRRGPGFDHEIAWVFLRAGLPVEIIAEFDTWRRIRDSEGAEGWVLGSLLSGRRTALVAPWLKGESAKTFPLRAEDDTDARVVSRVGPSVLVDIMSCGAQWCNVGTRGIRGWIRQDALWGVYPGETVE